MRQRSEAIFRNAQRYEEAARVLNAAALQLLIPSMVNAALSLELYFKALYFLENASDFKERGRHSHNFHHLFGALSDSTRAELSQEFQGQIQDRDMKDVEAVEREAGVTIPRDLEGNLKQWSRVFVDMRYVYDSTGPRTMMFFPELAGCVVKVIYRRTPEWVR
jgi:hypothetical protein